MPFEISIGWIGVSHKVIDHITLLDFFFLFTFLFVSFFTDIFKDEKYMILCYFKEKI